LIQVEERLRKEFLKKETDIYEQHKRATENLKEQSQIERQKACEEEREFARQRYQKQLERDEMEVLLNFDRSLF
jgi:hypothetical protein